MGERRQVREALVQVSSVGGPEEGGGCGSGSDHRRRPTGYAGGSDSGSEAKGDFLPRPVGRMRLYTKGDRRWNVLDSCAWRGG